MKKEKREKKAKKAKKENIIMKIRRLLKFISDEIWRVEEHNLSKNQGLLYRVIKILMISIRRFVKDNLMGRASALTYNTFFAIIPVLAVIFAIARGFGFQNIIQSQLFDYFPAQKGALEHAMVFVQSYLEHSKSGVFVGIGLILLLWAVITLISNIEKVFNDIWQVKKARSFYRKITDYISLIIVLPVLMIASSGVSILVSSIVSQSEIMQMVSPIFMRFLPVVPYILSSLVLTTLFTMMPNTRVNFIKALPAGTLCGVALQLFQYIYINGQIWVSNYNAIYGSFAMLPLLLLWIQFSWTICLYGATLSFATQNIRNYDYENDTNTISRRYLDFVSILVLTIIVKRFKNGETPLTISQISRDYYLPYRLATQVIYLLADIGILNETPTKDDRVNAYQPAIDIHEITVSLVLTRIDQHGSEKFNLDTQQQYKKEWESILESREGLSDRTNKILLLDL